MCSKLREAFYVLTARLGPGVLTRGLLKLPPSQVKKIIVLEESENYLKYLRVWHLKSLVYSPDDTDAY